MIASAASYDLGAYVLCGGVSRDEGGVLSTKVCYNHIHQARIFHEHVARH